MSKVGIKLKKNKTLGMIWHEESTVVFDKDKLVIGRFENDALVPLDDTCIDLCKQYRFKYNKELLKDEEEQKDDDSEENSHNSTDDEEQQSAEEIVPSVDEDEQQVAVETALKVDDENIYLSSIIGQFTLQINNVFDNNQRKSNCKISELENSLVQKDNYILELETELQNERSARIALNEKLQKISQLFS